MVDRPRPDLNDQFSWLISLRFILSIPRVSCKVRKKVFVRTQQCLFTLRVWVGTTSFYRSYFLRVLRGPLRDPRVLCNIDRTTIYILRIRDAF